MPQQRSLNRGCCGGDQQTPNSFHAHPDRSIPDNAFVHGNNSAAYEDLPSRPDTGGSTDLGFTAGEHNYSNLPNNSVADVPSQQHPGNSSSSSSYPQQPFTQHNPSSLPMPVYPGGNDVAGPEMPSMDFNTMNEVTTQVCLCGPGCQCFACASHPYNDATQMRVEELTDIMNENGDFTLAQAVQPRTLEGDPFGHYLDNQTVPNNSGAHGDFTSTSLPEFDANGSRAYQSLRYNVGLGCATGSCRCGEGCLCQGCIAHDGHSTS